MAVVEEKKVDYKKIASIAIPAITEIVKIVAEGTDNEIDDVVAEYLDKIADIYIVVKFLMLCYLLALFGANLFFTFASKSSRLLYLFYTIIDQVISLLLILY